jgi:hypothetical protein
VKITIATQHGFRAIEAYLVHIEWCGIYAHKSLKKPNGWTASCGRSGYAVAHGTSKKDVTDAVQRCIKQHGVEKFRKVIEAAPAAPSPNNLPDATLPAPKQAAWSLDDLDRLVNAISDRVGGLGPDEKLAVAAAFTCRNGRLKAQAPNSYDEVLANAAWNGLQPNAFKVQYSSCFHKGAALDLLLKLSKFSWPAGFDKDRAALEALGVW